MKNSFDHVAHRLVRDGRAAFPLKTSDLILRVVAGLQSLVNEPEKVQSRFLVNRSKFEDQEEGADDGLIFKDGGVNPTNGDVYDEKWYFQVKPGLPTLLKAQGADMHGYGKWIGYCMELHERSTVQQLGIAKGLDRCIPGINLYELMSCRTAMSLSTLRLLLYKEPKSKQNYVVGKKHVDRCALTSAIAELRPALRLFESNGEAESAPELYVARPDEVLVFAGAKAEYLTDLLPAQGHDVFDMVAATEPPRWSIVHFGHTNTPVHPKYLHSRKLPDVPSAVGQAAAATM